MDKSSHAIMASNLVKFGRYTLLGLVARGGMGEIYHARYDGVAGFEKTCIIKKIRREYARDKSFVERFLDEGRLLVSLTHSNIVQIFDMGVVDGEYYLAMEYVDGADLRVLLRHIAPNQMPIAVAIGVCIEVLRGLSYAHRSKDSSGCAIGIVHGDVSPSNILVSSEGEVKLIDFGIARPARSHSGGDKVHGKLAYMSPEQARGEALDCRTDVFSAGIVLFEMLAGRRPFGDNVEAMLCDGRFTCDLSVTRDIVLPEQKGEFDAILAKAMAPSAEQRYQTADAFSDDLIAYARNYHLICGQREIFSYFHPYIEIISKSPKFQGSTDEVMAAALDAMIVMQSPAATRTRTLTSSAAADDIADRQSDVSSEGALTHDLADNPPDGIFLARNGGDGEVPSVLDRENAEPSSNADASRSFPDGEDGRQDENWPMMGGAISGVRAVESVRSRGTAVARFRRALVKMRYMLIGAVGALLVISTVVLYRMSSSSVSLESLRQTLEGGHSHLQGNVPQESERSLGNAPDVDDGANRRSSDGNSYRTASSAPFSFGMLSKQIDGYVRGMPFAFYTEPELATIYIVEGVYRSLRDKQFTLVAEEDAEIAIQASGYETCFYRIHFDDIASRTLGSVSWRGCENVESTFSTDSGRMEVLIHLSPIRARRDGVSQMGFLEGLKSVDGHALDPQDESGDGDKADKPASEESSRDANDERKADPLRSRPATGLHAQTTNDSRKKSKEDVENAKLHRISVRSNVAGTLVAADKSCELPCTLDLPSNEPYEVRPRVGARQIGLAYSSSAQGDGDISIDFCSMIVRIQESYVAGDPSPYQVADIAVNGRLAVRQSDKAKFVLPCGAYEIDARTETESGRLEGKMSVDVNERAKTYVFAIPLSFVE